MKLMTKELEKTLSEYPFGLQEGKFEEADVIVKFFNPTGAGTWLITEGEKQEDGTWMLWGYCHIVEWEWGYVYLPELEALRLPYGLTIERELYVTGRKVKDYI